MIISSPWGQKTWLTIAARHPRNAASGVPPALKLTRWPRHASRRCGAAGGRQAPSAAKTLDFTRPTALMLMGILGLVADYDQARSIVSRLMAALPPGSYLAVYDGADTDPAYVEAIRRYNGGSGAVPYTPRSPEQMVTVSRWRPGWQSDPPEVACVGGVGRKP